MDVILHDGATVIRRGRKACDGVHGDADHIVRNLEVLDRGVRQDLLHELDPEGECHPTARLRRTQRAFHIVADPDPGDQAGGEADKPHVRSLGAGARLPGQWSPQDARTGCGAPLHDPLHHVHQNIRRLIYGSRAARGKYIIMGDSDDSYDFSDMLPFVRELRGGSELVMGNRFRGEIKPGAMPWLNRWLGTPVLSALGRLFFGSPIGDFNCGLRGFSAGAFQKMDLRTNGMEFASEMIVKATLLKLKISEVPTTLSPDGRSRPPHLRRWRDGWRHLRFMLLYSPRWLFLYPGGLLMTLGLLLSLWLLPGPRFIGRVGFDIHTMIYAAIMMFVGYQAVTFAVFTKVFAITHGLLPKDAKFHRAFRITLETGLAVGGVLVALGLIISMVALGYWERRGFGPLDPIRTLRVVTPGTICLTIGFQTVFSSFFLSVLGLVKR